MINPPLQRHPALQPFSRDHYTGLVQARHLLRAGDGGEGERREAIGAFMHAWSTEIAEHFADEEALLTELMTVEQQDRLEREHGRLRQLAAEAGDAESGRDRGVAWARSVGQLLEEHIRWEERELFPAIERACTGEELAALERRTAALEARRPRATCSRAQRDEQAKDPPRNEA
jgi:hemerythrin